MDLYLLASNLPGDYDTYDSMVYAANSSADAVKMADDEHGGGGAWPSPENVACVMIGVAKRGTVAGAIIKSFNAG